MTRFTAVAVAGLLLSFAGVVGLVACTAAFGRPHRDGFVGISWLCTLVTCGLVGERCG